MKTKMIYTLTMARYLIDNGFNLVTTVPDRRNICRNIWLFEQTPELDAVCKEYVDRTSKIRQCEKLIEQSSKLKQCDLLSRVKKYAELSYTDREYLQCFPKGERTAAFEELTGLDKGDADA